MWNPFRSPVKVFQAEAEIAFRFLITEFGFGPPQFTRWQDDVEMTCLSATTGVVVSYEQSYPGIFVQLSEACDLTKPMRGSFRGFDLAFLVKFRGGELPPYKSSDLWKPAAVKRIVHAYAEQTKKYADRILKGDFAEFRLLGWHVHDS